MKFNLIFIFFIIFYISGAAVLGQDSAKIEALKYEAFNQYEKGILTIALERTEELLKADPKNPMGLLMAGSIEYQLDFYNRAIAHLEAFLEVYPESSLGQDDFEKTLMLLGSAYEITNKLEKAEYYLTRLIDITTKEEVRVKAKSIRASAKYKGGNYEAVLADLDTVLAINPDDIFLHYQKGQIYFKMESFPEALDVFQKLYHQGKMRKRSRNYMFFIYAKLGNYNAISKMVVYNDYKRIHNDHMPHADYNSLQLLMADYHAGNLFRVQKNLMNIENDSSEYLMDFVLFYHIFYLEQKGSVFQQKETNTEGHFTEILPHYYDSPLGILYTAKKMESRGVLDSAAQTYRKLMDTSMTIKMYQRIALYEAHEFFIKNGYISDAEMITEYALSQFPHDKNLLINKRALLSRASTVDVDELEITVKKIRQGITDTFELIEQELMAAKNYFEHEDYTSALECVEEALRFRVDRRLRILRAFIELKAATAGQLESGNRAKVYTFRQIERSLDRSSLFLGGYTYFLRALMYLEVNEFREACRDLRRAVRIGYEVDEEFRESVCNEVNPEDLDFNFTLEISYFLGEYY